MKSLDNVQINQSSKLPNNKNSKTLVTLLILAYNQEQYISAAIDSAFSQDYSPLEVVLSDDCSSDKTFSIMQEKAAHYKGKATIVVRRNKVNKGLLEHINVAVADSSGEIIVMNAGDDQSLPSRVRICMDYFRCEPTTFAICSAYKEFIDCAKIQYPLVTRKRSSKLISPFKIIYGGGGYSIGATYCYRRECFTWPSSLPKNLLNEDRILPFRAMLLGQVKYLPETLVAYRLSPNSLSRDVQINKFPARKNRDHIDHLVSEVQHAYNDKLISASQKKLYEMFFKKLFRHMIFREALEKKIPIIGWAVSKILHAKFFIDYKIKQIILTLS